MEPRHHITIGATTAYGNCSFFLFDFSETRSRFHISKEILVGAPVVGLKTCQKNSPSPRIRFVPCLTVFFGILVDLLGGTPYAKGDTTISVPLGVGIINLGAHYGDLGQTISAPTSSDTLLDSFQFYAYGDGIPSGLTVPVPNGPITFSVQIFPFDPVAKQENGPAIYSSSPLVAAYSATATPQTFNLATGDLSLTPGNFYIVDFSEISGSTLILRTSSSSYSGGSPWIGALGGGTGTWGSLGNGINVDPTTGYANLAFQATFVPEPASFCLLSIMFGYVLIKKSPRVRHRQM